jgi:hypothetical protein
LLSHLARAPRPGSRLAAVIGAAALLALSAGPAFGHTLQKAGAYNLLIGWHVEPTYVGQPNAVEVTITDATGQPVTDLGADDLKVVVSTAGQDSPELTFDPAFDLEEGNGTPGQYVADILPTAPGDYTFHVTGAVHGQAVDITVTSGDQTFDPAIGTSDVEFPVKLPSMTEVSTHLDRIDSRISDLQGSTVTPADVDAANAAAASANDAATRALYIGGGIGLLGLVVGLVALGVAVRSRRRPA